MISQQFIEYFKDGSSRRYLLLPSEYSQAIKYHTELDFSLHWCANRFGLSTNGVSGIKFIQKVMGEPIG